MIANLSELKQLPGATYINDDLILLSDISKLPLSSEPKRSEHIIVALCLEGNASFVVDTKERSIFPGDVIIIQKDRVISSFMLSPDAKGLVMIWSKDFFDEMTKGIKNLNSLFIFSRMEAVTTLNENEMDQLQLYCKQVAITANDASNCFSKEMVQTLVLTMIFLVSNAINRQQQTLMLNNVSYKRSHRIFIDFLNLVEKHYKEERRVSWYANEMSISAKYLSETVKGVSQSPPNDWIESYVIREIRILLRTTSMSIKQIADEMNFPSQSFLGKYFKERIGISPKDYRKQ